MAREKKGVSVPKFGLRIAWINITKSGGSLIDRKFRVLWPLVITELRVLASSPLFKGPQMRDLREPLSDQLSSPRFMFYPFLIHQPVNLWYMSQPFPTFFQM